MRPDPRLPWNRLGVRTPLLRPRGGRARTRARGLHAGLLSPRAGHVSRGDGDEAVARHPQAPEEPQAPRAKPRHQDQALHQARLRAPLSQIQTEPRLIEPPDPRIGEVYLSQREIRTRVGELGAQIAVDYAGREPVLVTILKGAFVFLADLSRAVPIAHALDFVVLAGYEGALGGRSKIRLIKDLDLVIRGKNVFLCEN